MSNLRILLAEAHRGNRQLLLRALTAERPDVEVQVVSTAEQFRRHVAEHHYDCAIVSYYLGDTDAGEILRRGFGESTAPPVLVVSGCCDQQVVIDSFRNGSADFIPAAEAAVGDRLWRRVEHAVRTSRQTDRRRRHYERRQRWLARAAETDPLTGLYNRRFLTRQIRQFAYHRDRRLMMSCILMDLDHFKQINDRHGHVAGDQVLRRVAAQIQADLGGGDTAIRWGGEEFLILLASTNLAEVWIRAERLRSRLARLRLGNGSDAYGVTASFGVVSLPTGQMGYDAIDRADQAMYLAKHRGRDQICTWPMVQVDRALSAVDPAQAPVERRRGFLRNCRDVLGPTQLEHATDHCQRVQQTVERWGRLLRLQGDHVACIGRAGLIHDIGKCLIPEEILSQTAPLTAEQWALLNRRAEFGAHMGHRLGFDSRSVAYVREHHRALSTASDSPGLGAKLVAMADAAVAMQSHRTYRPARSTADVLVELRRVAAGCVDAAVVRTLCRADGAVSAKVA